MRKISAKHVSEFWLKLCKAVGFSKTLRQTALPKSTATLFCPQILFGFVDGFSTSHQAYFSSVIQPRSTLSTEGFTTTMFLKNKIGTIA